MPGTLSQQFCERAKPRPDGRERVFFDDAIEGLTLRVGKRKKRFELRVQWRRGGERGTSRQSNGSFWALENIASLAPRRPPAR
jgi:hypothetical protein